MKDTTETVCQRNSTETAPQNFVKLCSYEGQNVKICIFTGNADLIFFGAIYIPFEIWSKLFCATQMKLVFCPIARR